MQNTIRLVLGMVLLFALGGCSSVSLVEGNRDFVALVQQSNEAKRLHEAGTLDDASYESANEGYRTAFAEAGQKAVAAAEKADSDQAKASFLNLAVRNYLLAGPAGEVEVPTLSEEGLAVCGKETMQGLNGLPVTCGYFHIATAQAVNNEWARKVAGIKREAARARRRSPPEKLDSAKGLELERAHEAFLGQLVELEGNEQKIDWDNAPQRFREVFNRQQNIVYCNAEIAVLLLSDVVPSGAGWDRAAVQSSLEKAEADARRMLEAREGGLPEDTCSKLEGRGII